MKSLKERLSGPKIPPTWWPLAAILLLGTALRLSLLARSQMIIVADEALVGLQAFGILRGETPIYYPGQAYGGSLESYLVALAFLLFGASPVTLRLVPFVSSVLFIPVTYLLAKKVYGPPVGLLSALFVAVGPLLLLAFSLKTLGGYSQPLVLGSLALLLVVITLSPQTQGRKLWGIALGLGLICGLGLWVNPQFFYYLLPVALLLLAMVRKVRLAGLGLFAAGFLVGGLPLLLANLGPSESSSIDLFMEGLPPLREFGSYLKAATGYFATDALPTLLGLRPLKGEMAPTAVLVVVPLYLAAVLYALWQVGRDLLARRTNPAIVLVVTLLLAPFVFLLAVLTNGNYTVIIPGAGILVRYLMPFYSVLPILLAAFIWRLRDYGRFLAGALTALVLVANLWSYLSADPVDAMRSAFENVPLPASNQALIEFLESQDIHYVYTNHWIGYRLIFETQEQVIAFDYVDSLHEMDRIPHYGQEVEISEVPPAYILFNPGWERAPRLERKLDEMGIDYKKHALPPLEYIVYYDLSRRVHPSEVMEALVWPWY